jgi:uncharacterized protein YndB with AHSA1/START domain
MADIFHQFPIKASPEQVFEAVTTPEGLDAWWTKRSTGKPVEGTEYSLYFGEGSDWRAVVSKCIRNAEFELQMTVADKDWEGTRIGFRIDERNGNSLVHFHHLGWPEENDHFRISCYCWAMYLRLLKRHVEHDEFVPYENRLDA